MGPDPDPMQCQNMKSSIGILMPPKIKDENGCDRSICMEDHKLSYPETERNISILEAPNSVEENINVVVANDDEEVIDIKEFVNLEIENEEGHIEGENETLVISTRSELNKSSEQGFVHPSTTKCGHCNINFDNDHYLQMHMGAHINYPENFPNVPIPIIKPSTNTYGQKKGTKVKRRKGRSHRRWSKTKTKPKFVKKVINRLNMNRSFEIENGLETEPEFDDDGPCDHPERASNGSVDISEAGISKIMEMQNTIEKHLSERNALQGQSSEQAGRISELEEMLRNSQIELARAHANNVKLQRDLEENNAQKIDQVSELNGLQGRSSEQVERISELEDTLRNSQIELKRAQDKNAMLQRDLEENNAQKIDQEEKIAKLEKRYLNTQRELTSLSNFTEKLEQELREREVQLKLEEEKTRIIQEKLKISDQKLVQFSKIPDMEKDLKVRIQSLTKAHERYRSAEERVVRLGAQLEEMNEKSTELVRIRQSLRKNEEENARLSATIKKLLAESNNSLQLHLQERLHSLDEKNALTQELEKTKKFFEEVQTEKHELLKEVTKSRLEVEACKRQLSQQEIAYKMQKSEAYDIVERAQVLVHVQPAFDLSVSDAEDEDSERISTVGNHILPSKTVAVKKGRGRPRKHFAVPKDSVRKKHKCTFCESAFASSGELVRHVRYRHTHEKPHHCTVCDYSCVESSKLRRHMRSHTGERPYQCPHCNYAAIDTCKLKRHIRVHTGEKPYKCDICQTRFTQLDSLKVHRLIHSEKRPKRRVFKCELCPSTCGRKVDLKYHVKTLHTLPSSPLKCKSCGKSAFPDRFSYKLHRKSHLGYSGKMSSNNNRMKTRSTTK